MSSPLNESVQKTSLQYIQENLFSTWLEIDKQALEHNIKSYKKITQPALLALVIKSNAYGHGMQEIAALCDKNNLVDYLCTVSLSEAFQLRSKGIKKPIVALSILDENFEKALLHSIDVAVYDMQTVLQLNAVGQIAQKKVNIHIKIDTGLSRLGFLVNDALPIIKQIYQLPYITIKGIFTHFAEAENSDQTFTNQQISRFTMLLDTLEKEGIIIPLKHSSCSAAATANSLSHFTMARVGIGLYGLWPSPENKHITNNMHPHFSLKPVLTWKTRILQIKEVTAGSSIGYDRTFFAEKPMRIAILQNGYWDGYDRQLSNKGIVMINNHYARVVGRVAMNLCMIDITSLPVSLNDEVILLGNYPGVTADDLADRCQTINYEIVTRINPQLPRIIKD